jgi:hypothetical protein
MRPRYVLHDDARWQVVEEHEIDGEPAYGLSAPGRHQMWARVSECIPDDKPRVRRLRASGYVLEFDNRGAITIREQGRRKRFVTSLAAIYSQTVKATVGRERKAPTRVRRGLLRR